MTVTKVGGIAGIMLLVWGLLALALGFYSILNFIRLLSYLEYNKPEVFKKLCLYIPIINMRIKSQYNPLNLFLYFINDSVDDNQSLRYKNRFRLALIIALIQLIVTPEILKLV